jgi:hypothetical protein
LPKEDLEMPEPNDEIKNALQPLLRLDEAQLLAELGLRSQSLSVEPSEAGSYMTTFQAPQDAGDYFKNLGSRIYKRLSNEAFHLVCGIEGAEVRENLSKALKIDSASVLSILTPFLIANFGIAPAVAGVVAVIIFKFVFTPVIDEIKTDLCQMWQKRLPTEA